MAREVRWAGFVFRLDGVGAICRRLLQICPSGRRIRLAILQYAEAFFPFRFLAGHWVDVQKLL